MFLKKERAISIACYFFININLRLSKQIEANYEYVSKVSRETYYGKLM